MAHNPQPPVRVGFFRGVGLFLVGCWALLIVGRLAVKVGSPLGYVVVWGSILIWVLLVRRWWRARRALGR